MADIKILDFAKNVEQNRQSLIKHCKDNGKEADNSLSLSQIVNINNTINQEQQGFEGRWIDIDGTILKTEYVQDGGSFTPPPTPSFDSEYLEFVEWVSPRNYTDVHSDIDMGANYRSKLDENGRRNTYLFCAFDSISGLNPTLNLSQSSSGSTTYVDWGDGTTNEYTGFTSKTATHTYANEGQYVIKIWCNGQYWLRGGSSHGILGSSTLNKALIRLYLGENYNKIEHSFLYNGSNIQVLNIPNDVQSTIFPQLFAYDCYYINTIIIPNNFTRQELGSSGSQGIAYGCYGLKYLILPNTITSINMGLCQGCGRIEKVVLPKSILDYRSASGFSSCYNLKKVVLPDYFQSVDSYMFYNCYKLSTVTLPNTITDINSSAFSFSGLNTIVIPNVNTSIKYTFGGCYNLSNIVLPVGYNSTAKLNMGNYQLSKDSLINIAKSIKDNSETEKINTISFSEIAKKMFTTTYLDEQGNEVAYATEGAISLLQFITNKNWTVTFA